MNKENSLWVKCEVVLIFLALLVASVYSNNDMVERVAVPSILVLAASVLMLVRKIKGKSFGAFGMGVLLFSFAAGYFIIRASFSPVQSLATSDLLLMLPAYLTAVIASLSENRKVIARWLPWFAVVVVAVQSGPVLMQLHDPAYLPFRESIKDKVTISGFFGHSNFFAAFMGMGSAILFSYAAWGKSLSGRRQRYRRISWAVVAVWALVMLYLSSSRGAWVATAMAIGGIFLLALIVRVLINKDNLLSSVVTGVVGVTATIVIVVVGAQKIAQNRSLEDRGFFFSNARTDLLTLAADCEANNAIVGGGSRFYLYESRRVWDFESLNNTLRDAKFVHNEYIESLVNYGYIGFLILIGLIGVAFVLSGMQLISGLLGQKRNRVYGEWVAMHLSILGVILVVVVQSLVDFTLHVLPLTLMAGLVIGLLLRSQKSRGWCGLVCIFFMISSVVLLSIRSAPLVLSLPQVARAEGFLKKGDQLAAAESYERAGKISGHFNHYSEARKLYANFGDHSNTLKKVREIALICRELYPYDGANLVTLAKTEQMEKKWDKALKFATEAEYWVGNSESKYKANMVLAEVKYQILLNDDLKSLKSNDRMPEEKFTTHLLECWDLSQKSYYLGGRRFERDYQFINSMRVEYLMRSFFKYARLGQEAAEKQEMSQAYTYIEFARTLYKNANRILKGKMLQKSLQKFELTTQQVSYLKKNKVTIDSNLLKQLEQNQLIH